MIIGIDLGTTNSVVSVLKDDKPVTIPVDESSLLPSVVSLTEQGFAVGKVARNLAILEPANTVVSVKRRMGEDILLNIGDRKMRPEEVSALILKKIKQSVIAHLGLGENEVLKCVITVPAYFTEVQRTATKQAAEIAGLQVERIINEPTAAALTFGMSQLDDATYAIYDFGGGTFDVSVIESDAGLVEVLSSTGDSLLGGDDLDAILAEDLWKRFKEKNKLENTVLGEKEKARLRRIAEQSKIALSAKRSVDVKENFFYKHDDQQYHIDDMISRPYFEDLIRHKVDETVEHLLKAIEEAKITTDKLDGIILVGGSSRIPLISEILEEKTNIPPTLIDMPDEAVSHGATIQGAIIEGIEIDTILVDITPHSLGIAVIPSDPIEHMARLYAAKENDEDKDSVLDAAHIIPKNTPIPVTRSEKFTAVTEYQKGYKISIYQGEYRRYLDNKMIGDLLLEIKEPVEHGQIEVSFQLDINGILHIEAFETTTKEKVSGVFNSARGKKIQKKEVEASLEMALDENQLALLDRGEKLLAEGKLNDDDRTELTALMETYKSKKMEGDEAGATDAEAELLDLLYYLEDNAH